MTHAPANKNAWKKHAAEALAGTGVQASRPVHSNQTAPALVAEALRRHEGRLSVDGAFMVETGVHTGRSVQDKFVVDEPSVTADIWWGKVNQRMPVDRFNAIKGRVQAYLQGQELFTQDLYAGADPEHRVRVRLVTTQAWNALFARNMFIRPPEADLASFEPDYVILHAPLFQTDPEVDGVRSSTTIALSFEQKLIVIAGSEYAGEVKKSIFTVMNWLLPRQGRDADALQRQYRQGRRRRAVLRPVRHRQDHPVVRPRAQADRRRRAWLGRERHLQLRRRLLRQGDQPVAGSRTRNLGRLQPLRVGAGKRHRRRSTATST